MKLNRKILVIGALFGLAPALFYDIRDIVLFHNFTRFRIVILFFMYLVLMTFLTFVVIKEIEWLQTKTFWTRNVIRRILIEFFFILGSACAFQFLVALIVYPICLIAPRYKLIFTNDSLWNLMIVGFAISLTIVIILFCVFEGVFFINEWKNRLVHSQNLQEESIQAQLEALKNQVNPHFLFNTLNVLSDLVYSNPAKAEEFVEQLACVYRYILSLQNNIVVKLNDEMDFIKSYIFLQKSRFNEGLEVVIQQNINKNEFYVPPLAIQFVIENAIKYNEISKNKPLIIRVFIKGKRIFIVNNIQQRELNDNLRTEYGFKSLSQRYFHLTGFMPLLEVKNEEFIISLPLLMSNRYNEEYLI